MNQKTFESLRGAWIGSLLEISEEEIQKAADALPEIKTQENEQGGSEVKFPFLLGEMNQYERALNALFDKKYLEHKEICRKEHADEFKGDFSPEHEELHRILPILKDEMWNSIHARFPDAPGDTKVLSKGGKIFATQNQKNPMQEIVESLFGGAFPSRGMIVEIGHR